MKETISSLQDLDVFAKSIYSLQKKDDNHAVLITLSGELGAGKTAFTKSLARQLGVSDSITSPTFVIRKEYLLHNQNFTKLIHIDAYKLEDSSELNPLRFSEDLNDKNNIIFLEWPEKVVSAIPGYARSIRIEVIDNNTRIFTYES